MYKYTYKNIGLLLKTKRELKDLSQTQLAWKLDWNVGQCVSNIERAVCSLPYGKAPLLCRVLDVTQSEILQAMQDDLRDNFGRYFVDQESLAVGE